MEGKRRQKPSGCPPPRSALLRGDELRKQLQLQVEELEDVRTAQEADISGVAHFFIESKGQVIPMSGAQEADTFVHVFKKLGVA